MMTAYILKCSLVVQSLRWIPVFRVVRSALASGMRYNVTLHAIGNRVSLCVTSDTLKNTIA